MAMEILDSQFGDQNCNEQQKVLKTEIIDHKMKAKHLTRLFKRILYYTKPYKWRFNGVIAFAISLSIFAALRPYLLKQTVWLHTNRRC
jgi:hypothetical protein